MRVAVLGGGAAALAAAFELTATPELRRRYEVTVYQPGWRLGGKCASGRNPRFHDRIEEHGVHVWFGFYDNAFNLIQRCYDELERPAGAPLRTWEDAFERCEDIVLYEQWDGRWIPRHFHVPPDDSVPGREEEITFWHVAQRVLEWLLDRWRHAEPHVHEAVGPEAPRQGAPWFDWLHDLADEVEEQLDDVERAAASRLLELAHKLAQARAEDSARHAAAPHHPDWLQALLRRFRDWLRDEVIEPCVEHDELRLYYMLADFWTAVICGMLADDLVERGFREANDEDLLDWLRRHGADELTLEHAPFLRGFYDLVFGYEEGDKSRPNLAAGKALQAMIRMVVAYKGAILWKMQAGMGDTVFAPQYEVLRARGVRFEFFHWVTRLGLSEDGRSVGTVEVVPQVRLASDEYRPLLDVGGLPCWPSEPDWTQIADADELRGANLEREPNPLELPARTLRRGEDFDEVVLGIPVGGLHQICAELAAANRRFAAMLGASRTVVSVGVQLWLDSDDLGWAFGENSIMSAYVEKLDTYCDMTHLLSRESWPAGSDCAGIAYFCGVMPHDVATSQAAADEHVRGVARRFLAEDSVGLWPGAADGSRSFDWGRLVDGFDAQFFRANFQPTERYTLTPAGSVEHRLKADESGFENLKLAGDWTRNGIDGGSVEAAITSGMQAARAICGSPEHIAGERGWLVDD